MSGDQERQLQPGGGGRQTEPEPKSRAEELADIFGVAEDDGANLPPILPTPVPGQKRPRGRPRKPRWDDRLRTLPADIAEWGQGNIDTPEAISESNALQAEHRQDKELDRIAKTRCGLRRAYKEGRNTANQDRAAAKRERFNDFVYANLGTINNPNLSIRAAAAHIARRGKTFGLRNTTIREYIALARKSGQGQIAPENRGALFLSHATA